MNDGRKLMHKVYCSKCSGSVWLRGAHLFTTLKRKTAERVQAAHAERTGHRAYSHNIVGRYVTPLRKGEPIA